jgi:hypothetical protein
LRGVDPHADAQLIGCFPIKPECSGKPDPVGE